MRKLAEFFIIIMLMVGTIAGAIEFSQVGSFESLANLASVFAGLGWFLMAFFTASLFTAYLVVIAPSRVILRFLAIPAWLVFSLSMLVTIDQFMGYAYPALPPQAKVLAYQVIKDEKNVKIIEAWMWIKDEQRARAYKFPYTLEREKALHEGQDGAKKGLPVEVKLQSDAPPGDPQGELVIYNWDLDAEHPSKIPEDVPMSGILDNGEHYQINEGGEIEIITPPQKELKKNDWDDISPPGTDPAYFGYGINDAHE